MQKGYIYEANGAWHVRYRLKGEQVSRKLADYNDQYRTKRSVRPLADEIIDSLESRSSDDLDRTLKAVGFRDVAANLAVTRSQGLFNLTRCRLPERISEQVEPKRAVAQVPRKAAERTSLLTTMR